MIKKKNGTSVKTKEELKQKCRKFKKKSRENFTAEGRKFKRKEENPFKTLIETDPQTIHLPITWLDEEGVGAEPHRTQNAGLGVGGERKHEPFLSKRERSMRKFE